MELHVAVASSHYSHPSFSRSPSSSQSFSASLPRRSSLVQYDRRKFSKCIGNSSVKTIKWGLNAKLNHPISNQESTKSRENWGKYHDHHKPFDDSETPEFSNDSIDIPFSLKMMRRTMQWQKGLIQDGETAYCSVKKAFNSTVFIIRELQSFALQIREILFYEDLQGILATVHKEIHASFVWLFQKVFSQTPTLMVYLMILLANYSVYSLSSSASISSMQTPVIQEILTVEEDQLNLDSSIFNKPIFGEIGGGGGDKYRPIASSTDGDNRFSESNDHNMSTRNEESSKFSGSINEEYEEKLWQSLVDEAYKMQVESRDGLDQETMQLFVSPIHAQIELDHHSEYLRTEKLYQMELAQEPNNSLLLENFAQFLYLCLQDFDRAEEYFKRAIKIEPKDAEALNRYANFLWEVRKDVLEAEEIFLEAMDIEPENAFYKANYARFLWSTGEEDICFV